MVVVLDVDDNVLKSHLLVVHALEEQLGGLVSVEVLDTFLVVDNLGEEVQYLVKEDWILINELNLEVSEVVRGL